MIRRTLLAILLTSAAGCHDPHPRPAASATPPPPWLMPPAAGVTRWERAGDDPVLAAAGDIAISAGRQQDTAALLQDLLQVDRLAAVLALGDTAYPTGSAEEFASFYEPSWGLPALKAVTRAVPGNHEYFAAPGDATGYFDYFDGPGAEDGPAGRRGEGWYSFDVAGWHLVALNTNLDCTTVACDAASPQGQWLAADLAAHPGTCTLAFMHAPRYQQGTVHGDFAGAADMWDMLYRAGVDVVLAGHEHIYGQLAPIDDQARRDDVYGIRSFVVGTGGAALYTADTLTSGAHTDVAEVVDAAHWGVLEVSLHPASYDWRFVSIERAVLYSGTGVCHGPPLPPATQQ